ncbi:MAG: hypothetical protein M1833_004925 [Piccolia ochrophora]|nr:MAG: hypothetical protein M1833_004925 [Piccolia ochrophora]
MAVTGIVDDLLHEAKAAEDVAAALFPFLNAIPQNSAEITGIMSELFAISSAVRDLSAGLSGRRYQGRVRYVLDQIYLVVPSLSATLDDIFYMFERLGITPNRGPQTYIRVWREIQSTFVAREASLSLLVRLEIYRTFLLELFNRLTGAPPGPCDLPTLQRQIENMRATEDGSIDEQFAGLSIHQAASGRPKLMHPSPLPQGRPRSSMPRNDNIYPPPPAPEAPPFDPPLSATTESSESVNPNHHWALDVFDGSQSITPFTTPGLFSRCDAKNVEGVDGGLSQFHRKIVDLDFDNAAVVIRLHYDPRDNRARVHCLAGFDRPEASKTQSWSPLSVLQVARTECCLRLSHVSRSSRTRIPWATLRFPSYERLVLFYCTFIALKCQGPPDVKISSDEYKIAGEIELHAWKIVDDDFQHALRIFKDKDSRGVRLQASVLSGELKGMPVWTAFITRYLGVQSWMKRIRTKVVQLKELRPYVFSSDYMPPRGKRGEHELRFKSAEDAVDFTASVNAIKRN